MNIITLLLPATALFISFSTAVHAKKFSYTYLEASYANQNSNGIDGIFNKHGSVAIDDKLHVIFKDSTVWLKPNSVSRHTDLSEGSLGLGYHTPLNDKTDLTASASLRLMVKTKTVQSQESTTKAQLGYGVSVGVRHQLSKDFEATLNATHHDINNADLLTNTSVSVGGRYNLTDELSAGINVSTALKERHNSSDMMTASLRWSSL